LENSKTIVIKISILLLVILSIILLLNNYFKPEYHDQVIDLERIGKVKLDKDILSLKDFQPTIGIVNRYYKSPDYIDNFSMIYNSTLVSVILFKSREEALEHYAFIKEKWLSTIQYESISGPNDMYCLSKVKRLRDENFAGLVKSNSYFSEVIFVKNNLFVSVDSSSGDKTGSNKQIVIDLFADYLEKLASEENKL